MMFYPFRSIQRRAKERDYRMLRDPLGPRTLLIFDLDVLLDSTSKTIE